METENKIPDEVKAKIFALYLGSLINENDSTFFDELKGIDMRYSSVYCSDSDFKINGCSLYLKPLSMISDEDAVGVAKVIFSEEGFHDAESGKRYVYNMLSSGLAYSSDYWSFEKTGAIIDYLRSKSYALPYGPYTVDQLVEEGIYKLQTQ